MIKRIGRLMRSRVLRSLVLIAALQPEDGWLFILKTDLGLQLFRFSAKRWILGKFGLKKRGDFLF
ncbi:hypothetical protein [Nitrosococcus oceani]|uniref:Uncharacterized protein n=1 Tax=Nitrosococcus oceani C-27 TaxID=314279 RepID=A0A0E2ZLR7_9GAMM|nr:hypothetical protein [Nitrosococcus oceani]KFI19277.1 hypothetical protein IB75_10025 [Nitrosococcus oceani C-27]